MPSPPSGSANRVRRLAYVPDADLPALFSGAACVAIVSLYEGFGMPALEALACGAPLLVSNRGSLPEIAGDAARHRGCAQRRSRSPVASNG